MVFTEMCMNSNNFPTFTTQDDVSYFKEILLQDNIVDTTNSLSDERMLLLTVKILSLSSY